MNPALPDDIAALLHGAFARDSAADTTADADAAADAALKRRVLRRIAARLRVRSAGPCDRCGL